MTGALLFCIDVASIASGGWGWGWRKSLQNDFTIAKDGKGAERRIYPRGY